MVTNQQVLECAHAIELNPGLLRQLVLQLFRKTILFVARERLQQFSHSMFLSKNGGYPQSGNGWAEEQSAGRVFECHRTHDSIRMENTEIPKEFKGTSQNQKTCFLALKCPTLVCWPAVEIAKACSRYPRNIQKLFFPVLQKSQLIFHSTRKPLRGIQLIESELRAVAVTVLKTAPGLNIFIHRSEFWLWMCQCLFNLEHSFSMSMQYVVQCLAQHCVLRRRHSSCTFRNTVFRFDSVRLLPMSVSCIFYYCDLLKCSNPAQ